MSEVFKKWLDSRISKQVKVECLFSPQLHTFRSLPLHFLFLPSSPNLTVKVEMFFSLATDETLSTIQAFPAAL